MPDNDSNLDNNILFVIDENGKIFSVPEIEGEESHFQPYIRLNTKLNNKIGEIYSNDTGVYLSKKVAKLGYINIYPLKVFDTVGAGFVVVFPENKTEKQLKALESLYDVLEKKEGISFYKKTVVRNEILDFAECETGLEKLKCFVEELKRIIRNSKKMKEDNYECRFYFTRM